MSMTDDVDGIDGIIDYDAVLEPEWEHLTFDKVLGLLAELKDWKDSRVQGGYDVHLVEGAIAVCRRWLDQELEKKG